MSVSMLRLLAAISATPDPSGLPGSSVADRLVNGLFFYTLLGCLAGLLISVLVWVFGSRSQNYKSVAPCGEEGEGRVPFTVTKP